MIQINQYRNKDLIFPKNKIHHKKIINTRCIRNKDETWDFFRRLGHIDSNVLFNNQHKYCTDRANFILKIF